MGGGLFLGWLLSGIKGRRDRGRIERALNQEIEIEPKMRLEQIDPIDPSLQEPTQSVELEEAKRITKKGENLRELLYRAWPVQPDPPLRIICQGFGESKRK